MRNVHQEIRSTVLWIALATVVGLVGIWQAKVAIGQGLSPHHEELPPPLKTRFAVRPPPEVFSGKVDEDYIARCTKGLTNREIGWIVEDFRNAGLALVDFNDKTTDDEILAYRGAQQRWYHGALKDGLRLTAAQSSEAGQKLDAILREVTAEFRNDRKAGNSAHPVFQQARFDILLSHAWLFLAYDTDSPSMFRFMPWDLCALTPDQAAITRMKAFPPSPSSPAVKTAQSPSAEPKLSLQSETPLNDELELPEWFAMADAVFPYLKSQEFILNEELSAESPSVSLENVRRLHPAQLKIMLLFYPQFAAEIQSALDKAAP